MEGTTDEFTCIQLCKNVAHLPPPLLFMNCKKHFCTFNEMIIINILIKFVNIKFRITFKLLNKPIAFDRAHSLNNLLMHNGVKVHWDNKQHSLLFTLSLLCYFK